MAKSVLYVHMLLFNLCLLTILRTTNTCKDHGETVGSLNSIHGLKNRALMMTRFWRIFLYYCGPEKIDDSKLLAAEDCSPRKLLVSLTFSSTGREEKPGLETLLHWILSDVDALHHTHLITASLMVLVTLYTFDLVPCTESNQCRLL